MCVIQPAVDERNFTPTSTAFGSSVFASAGVPPFPQMLTDPDGGGGGLPATIVRTAPGVSRFPLSSTARESTE